MGEYWSSSDVVAWTDHDGPQRPPTGPPTAWYRGLAGAFGAWFVLAVIGCEVIHHSGGEHVPSHPPRPSGPRRCSSACRPWPCCWRTGKRAGPGWPPLLGGVACAISLTQWSLVPAYTALEAGGFAVLGLCGLALGIAQLRARPSSRRRRRRRDEPTTPGLGDRPAGAPG